MATFHIGNRAYDLKSMMFEGLPRTELDGDIGPDDIVTFTAVLKEDASDELRHALSQHTFWSSFSWGEYEFRVRDARLTQPLADRDYGTSLLTVVFKVARQFIIGMTRPRGQYAPDPDSSWHQNVSVWLANRDHLRVKARELEQYEAEIAAKRQLLADAEEALAVRKSRLIETGTPANLHAVSARGF